MVPAPSQPPDWVYTYAAYTFCASMIAIYAWERFNTPSTNRSSTRQLLYWQSCVGYILSALSLFGVLSLLLEQAVWRDLLGLKDNQSLPAPLLATLAMTTLLPRVPLLSRVDRWLLDLFLDWAAIPAEVKRRAAALTPHGFTVDRADMQRLAERCDGLFGEFFASHLGDRRDTDLERSRLRFTRVAKLYLQIQDLSSEPRYSRFFDQHAEEYTALATETEGFIRTAIGELDLPLDCIRSPKAATTKSCRIASGTLRMTAGNASLPSRASLLGGTAIRDQRKGHRRAPASDSLPRSGADKRPRFSHQQSDRIGRGHLRVSGADRTPVLVSVHDRAERPVTNTVMPGPFAIAAKITLVRVATLALTVYLIQRYAFFRRGPGEQPRYFAYLVAGVAAAALTAAAGLVLHLSDSNPFAGVQTEGAIILLSLMLCTAVAFCCDDWTEETRPPRWLRPAEAAGCGFVMALGMVIVIAANLIPFQPAGGPLIAAFIGLPGALGAIVGACVPHIYRETRRVAAARRAEADREAPASGIALSPLVAETLALPRHTRPARPGRRRAARLAIGRTG